MLVDPVEHVADQLLQHHPWRYADLAPELTGDRGRELTDVGIVNVFADPCGRRRARGIDVADLPTKLDERGYREAGQPQLGSARIVETSVGGEVGGQPLGQW